MGNENSGAPGSDVMVVDPLVVPDPAAGGEPPTGGEPQSVTLSNEEYAALLDHVANLESKVINGTPQGRQDVRTLDSLIDEAGDPTYQGRVPAAPAAGVKLEDMSPDQIIGHIFNTIKKEMVEPLEIKLETLRLMNEIDKVASKPENKDFWEYADQVKEIALNNPKLSINRCYQLAKAEGKRGSGTPGDTGLVKKDSLLYTLPPRPKVQGGGGEKPTGVPRGVTTGSGELSRRDAASAAFDQATKGK